MPNEKDLPVGGWEVFNAAHAKTVLILYTEISTKIFGAITSILNEYMGYHASNEKKYKKYLSESFAFTVQKTLGNSMSFAN